MKRIKQNCEGRAASNQRWLLPALGNIKKRQLALFISASVLLSSCATLESQSGNPPAQSASNTAQSSGAIAGNSANSSIPVLTSGGSAEQQALIDEINRDGDPLDFQGYRENGPSAVAPQGEDIVELNYEQADLRLVLEELADALDITLIIDPSINNQVSIRTSANRPLSRADIWPLIRLLTRNAGVLIEQNGNVYTARQSDNNLPLEITTPEQLGDGTAARIMQATPLTYVSPQTATQILQPMLAPDGTITALGSRNLVLITGSEAQLQRVNELLQLVDADPFSNQGIRLYQLSNANAVEVAEELSEILTMIEGPNPAFQVRGIERINSILVTAPATRGFDEIGRWVRILDADRQEQVEQLFMYRVKNLAALELADTLSQVFEEDNDDDEDEPRPVNDNQQTRSAFVAVEGEDGQPRLVTQRAEQAEQSQDTGDAVSADLRVRIVADESTNSLLIRGTARDYRQLLTTIAQLDQVPLQVMVNAVIAQITLNNETRFGVDWSRVAANADLNPISTTTSTGFLPDGGLGGLMFTKGFLDGAARVEATLEAIATNNDVRLLARPSLTVSNNQEGEIQIGAQVPVESQTSIGNGGVATSSIQYRDTGIELYITPQINSDGVVNLVIRQVLSSVDSSAGGVRQNPTFNNQEISTTVVVRNGENVVLGGLIQNDSERLNTGIPGLNRVPVVGNLFSYQQRNQERRELFIVLRPEIVNLNEQSSVQYSAILQRFELASELFAEHGID
ncbi:MAG: type II secretion system secretin GspD [Gammaproteobacteria bacterium]